MVATPFILLAILSSNWVAAGVLVAYSALTDTFDGFIARRFQQESVLGAYLDPIADKLLIGSIYGVLWVRSDHLFCTIPAWFLGLVLIRECAILLGAFVLVLQRGYAAAPVLQPAWSGKLTMVVQICTICMLLLGCTENTYGLFLSWYGMRIAAVCMVWSMGVYIWRWADAYIF